VCEAVQTVTGHTVELAWADQGYTGEQLRRDDQAYGIELQVVKLAEAKSGFVLLHKRWVVERSFARAARFRRLAKDYERLSDVLRGLHLLVVTILMLPKAIPLLAATGNA
jgi:transposase